MRLWLVIMAGWPRQAPRPSGARLRMYRQSSTVLIFTSQTGQHPFIFTARFTNFRYWEALGRLLDYTVFFYLFDLRFFFTSSAVYSKDLNIASQYRKFVFTPRIWTIEIANSPSSDTQNRWNDPVASQRHVQKRQTYGTQNRWNDPVVSLLAIQSQQNADDERRAPLSGEAPF